jgi:hypothetical protein
LSTVELPDEVKNFITKHIDSVGKLEVLLFLVRRPNEKLSSEYISSELRNHKLVIQRHLSDLSSQGCLKEYKEEAKSYQFSTEEGDVSLMEKVLAAHTIYPMRLVQLIYEKPASSIKQFAEAFKIRKDDDENG